MERLPTLRIAGDNYTATIKYTAQDHFGLDTTDIMNPKFHHFDFFRIWFVLQHYNQFAFKPFFTNMETLIEISGSKNA